MQKNNDDLKTQELIKSISAIFRKLENNIANLDNNVNCVFSINESLRELDDYEKLIPLKYQKFYFKHYDGLTDDFMNKIILNTSTRINNPDNLENAELIKSIRFTIRSLEYLLANFRNDEKNISIINKLITSLNEQKNVVPGKYQKYFNRHFDYLKNQFATKENRNNCMTIKKTSPGHPDNLSSQCTNRNNESKSWRDSKWTSYRDYKYFEKTTMEKTTDPFLAKRLRRI